MPNLIKSTAPGLAALAALGLLLSRAASAADSPLPAPVQVSDHA